MTSNNYINSLIDSDKLRISVDPSKSFGFNLKNLRVGGNRKAIIAGPCSIESEVHTP